MDRFTADEIRFLLDYARQNREDSAALAEMPTQLWREAHNSEIKKMDNLIVKLEAMKTEAERPQANRIYMVFIDGKEYHSTSSRLSFQSHVQEIVTEIRQSRRQQDGIYLWEIEERLITDILDER